MDKNIFVCKLYGSLGLLKNKAVNIVATPLLVPVYGPQFSLYRRKYPRRGFAYSRVQQILSPNRPTVGWESFHKLKKITIQHHYQTINQIICF